MLPGAQQYTTVESAAALSIQEKFKGKYDENIHNKNGQYRNEWYKRAENMVSQLDGTYNVSDDSDSDSHSYLDLASSNIIAHRMRGQKQRYETDIRAHTSKCLAFKESTKPKVNINTKGQKVPDDENIDINKIAQGERPKEGRNMADITAKQHKDKEAKKLVPEKVKRIQGQNDSKNICRANDKSASFPVSYGRRVTSRTEITCLADAIELQRTHTEYRSPIGVNNIGQNPASGHAKQSQPIRGSQGHQSGTIQRHHSKVI